MEGEEFNFNSTITWREIINYIIPHHHTGGESNRIPGREETDETGDTLRRDVPGGNAGDARQRLTGEPGLCPERLGEIIRKAVSRIAAEAARAME